MICESWVKRPSNGSASRAHPRAINPIPTHKPSKPFLLVHPNPAHLVNTSPPGIRDGTTHSEAQTPPYAFPLDFSFPVVLSLGWTCLSPDRGQFGWGPDRGIGRGQRRWTYRMIFNRSSGDTTVLLAAPAIPPTTDSEYQQTTINSGTRTHRRESRSASAGFPSTIPSWRLSFPLRLPGHLPWVGNRRAVLVVPLPLPVRGVLARGRVVIRSLRWWRLCLWP